MSHLIYGDPYTPLPAPYEPGELPRYIEQEMFRLGQYVRAITPERAYFVIDVTDSVTIGPIESWETLFTNDDPQTLFGESMSWDKVTGRLTVAPGVYDINCTLNFNDPPGTGNRSWAVGMRYNVIQGFQTGPLEESVNSAANDFSIFVNAPVIGVFEEETIFEFEGMAMDAQFTNITNFSAFAQVWRLL